MQGVEASPNNNMMTTQDSTLMQEDAAPQNDKDSEMQDEQIVQDNEKDIF